MSHKHEQSTPISHFMSICVLGIKRIIQKDTENEHKRIYLVLCI